MVTGKGSKRVETTITLEDTDDDDEPPPTAAARRSVVNKRRRTVLEVDDDDDDDDDDDVIVVPQTRAGNSNRLVKLIYFFSHNDSVYQYLRSALKNSNGGILLCLLRRSLHFDLVLISILTSLLLLSSLFIISSVEPLPRRQLDPHVRSVLPPPMTMMSPSVSHLPLDVVALEQVKHLKVSRRKQAFLRSPARVRRPPPPTTTMGMQRQEKQTRSYKMQSCSRCLQ